MRKLAVLDIDETLMEWDGFRIVEPRSCLYEFLDALVEHPMLDLALFSTAHIRYVRWVRDHFLSDYDFVRILGGEHIQYYEGEKVKNLSIFMNQYELKNMVLVDDKPRNGRLQPNNYIHVRPPSYYRKRNIFDDELLHVSQKVKRALRI